MRRALLFLLLLADGVFSAEVYSPMLLPGASGSIPGNVPLSELLVREWSGKEQWVIVGKDLKSERRPVKSCAELDAAHESGEYGMDTAQVGAESMRMRECQDIRWLMVAKPAKYNALTIPLCLDRVFYYDLLRVLDSSWGRDGIVDIEERHCSSGWAEAVISYDRLIEPPNDIQNGLSVGVVTITYRVQGDFDGDGWLDIIADVAMYPDSKPGEPSQGVTSVHGVVKISGVDGIRTLTKVDVPY